jgi:hypothetical protein
MQNVQDLSGEPESNLGKILDRWLENPPEKYPVGWESIVRVLESEGVQLKALAKDIRKEKMQNPGQVGKQRMEQDGNEVISPTQETHHRDPKQYPSELAEETDSTEDYGSRLEADYGQNEGQRCIPVGVLMQFCRGVLRMRIKSSDETTGHAYASGFFVELNSSHWIITTCHTLLDEDDGKLMMKGKHKDINDLLGKMMMNLRSCTFFLPNEQFELTQLEEPLDAIVPDIRHLVEDPENDIVAIRCNNPEDLGASAFSIKLEAMSEILPLEVGHCLTIVHCPWKLAKRSEWDNTAVNNHMQYSSGNIKELVPKGRRPRAIYYDMVTYKGSSGSPVFFAGRSGIVVIGIHRRYHDGDNQCSYLSEVFIKHMRNNMKRMK